MEGREHRLSRTQEDLLHLAMMQGWVEPRDKREDHAILALVRIGYLEPINERPGPRAYKPTQAARDDRI